MIVEASRRLITGAPHIDGLPVIIVHESGRALMLLGTHRALALTKLVTSGPPRMV